MKRILLISIVFTLTLVLLSSCAKVNQTQTTDINIRIGNQSNEPDNSAPTVTSEAEKTPLNEATTNRAWSRVLVFVIGIPLSIIGIVTLYIVVREVRKRRIP